MSSLRISSVPDDHAYVRHIRHPDGDEGPCVGIELPLTGAATHTWRPSPKLGATWVRAHASDFDVFHLHFGFEHRSPGQLRHLCDALNAADRPLVLTVHDLRNPHQLDPRPHRANLDVLVPRATEVITLTPGAAHEIRSSWGRSATVIPHPHVVPLPAIGGERPVPERPVVGVSLKSGRTNSAGPLVARALHERVSGHRISTLQVEANDDPGGREAARLTGPVPVALHPRFDDDQLWDHLRRLSVAVLPYRFGSHSGWLEACRDLGTAVVAPSHGHYAEQGPCPTYRLDGEILDVASLHAAVDRALAPQPGWAVTAGERYAQRVAIADAHDRVYARAVDAVRPGRRQVVGW